MLSKVRRRWIVLGCLLAVGLAIAAAANWLLAGLPDPSAPLSRAGAPSTLITDRQGRTLYEFINPDGSKFQPLPLSAIPLACQQATVATEDGHFYQHPGIDPVAIARATWQNLTSGHTVSGASTLTQQIARSLYFSADERTEQSLKRKLREAALAIRIELRYNKPEILALYLNTTYYGHFAVGIEAAAQAYFGMHASELDTAQCALLAGLPQNAALYNPLEYPEAAQRRQAVVLGLMAEDGYLTAEQAAQVGRERLTYAGTPFPIEAPHFVMWVQNQLDTLLPPEQVRAGGLRVVTTLNLDWQRQAEAIVTRRLAGLRPCSAGAPMGACDPAAAPDRRVSNAALVALDPATGAVRAMVGSPDYFNATIDGAVNGALSLRQPGSAIKPVTYAAAFDPARAGAAGRAAWTPATLIADVRTVFPTAEGDSYVPQDYDLKYHGPVTAASALANSYNIPAVKALQYIGVDALIEQAQRQGITWLADLGYTVDESRDDDLGTAAANDGSHDPKRFGLALTLGGGEVRLLDLTAAYAVFANGGRRVQPYAIERVETLDGRTLWKRGQGPVTDGKATPEATPTAIPDSQPALDQRVAYLITSILSDNELRLPAFGPNNVLEIGRPAAAKTGTTTNWRDNWTMGYTPDLVTGVWVGNADNTPMLDISGVTGAGPIWHDFMAAAVAGTPVHQFTRPDGLVEVEVCADSGLLPLTAGPQPLSLTPTPVPCPSRTTAWFIAGTEPKQVDLNHYQVAIDARTGQPATAATPPAYLRPEIVWQMPADLQGWAQANKVPQLPVTSLAQATGQPGATGPLPRLAITSPDPNTSYRLDPGLPAAGQAVAVTVGVAPDLTSGNPRISLLIDGASVALAGGPDYTMWWPLVPGRHIFQARAVDSAGAEILSAPVIITVQP